VSSKRVVSIFTLINILIFCYVAVYTGKTLPEFMFDGLALIAGGGLGLTVVEAIFKKPRYNRYGHDEEEYEDPRHRPHEEDEPLNPEEFNDEGCQCAEECQCKQKEKDQA
jgi:hypothetical protein